MGDRIVGALVRLAAFVARFAQFVPGLHRATWRPGTKPRVLLLGYNGMRNTGADARLVAIVDQLERLFGTDALDISAMTLDASKTSCYFEGRAVTQIEFGPVAFWPILKACSSHHAVILCEGSTFKSRFANALTLFFCEAAGVARAQGKPCIAYGSEAGHMDPFVQKAVRDLCGDVRFVARNQESLDTVGRLGLQGVLGTDTAWTLDGSPRRARVEKTLRKQGWDGAKPLVGIACINPFWWPVRPSFGKLARMALTGKRDLHYRAWYFHTWSAQRKELYERYLDALAHAVNELAASTACHPVLIGMEALDAAACRDLGRRLDVKPLVALSADHDAFTMSELLCNLDTLVTSRYHACVLGMRAGVPTVCVSMDERLDNLARDCGIAGRGMLLAVDDPQLEAGLRSVLTVAREHADELTAASLAYRDQAIRTLDAMGEVLGNLLGQSFPGFVGRCGALDELDTTRGR